MNRKGFTLIEVILAIAIMSILALILVPNIFVLIDENKERTYNNLIKNIESSAKIYVSENKYGMGFDCSNYDESTIEVSIKEMINKGALTLDSTGKIINPKTDKEMNLEESKVLITYSCDNKTFTYVVNEVYNTSN